MKLTRLLLLLSLLLSLLIVPEAFGARLKGSSLSLHKGVTQSACYDIDCGDGSGGSCCGTVDRCLGYCDGICGVAPGTCQYQQ